MWQPISTAPRDGAEIIGYDASEPGVVYGMRWEMPPFGNPYWKAFTNDTDQWEPTHWMNLPNPPDEVIL